MQHRKIASLTNQMAKQGEDLALKDEKLAEKDVKLAEEGKKNAEKDKKLAEKDNKIAALLTQLEKSKGGATSDDEETDDMAPQQGPSP